MSKITKHKYYNFMMELYGQREFNLYELAHAHSIGSRLLTVMRERGLIKRDGEVTRWIGDMPTQTLATMLAKECTRSSRMEKVTAKITPNQLSIKPLKRVPSVVQPPVQPIEMNNDAQLTWMHLALIFCAGIIAGGIIATIWK